MGGEIATDVRKATAPRPRNMTMLIRFDCPACGGSHSFDMPETTIHMTCSRTHKIIQLRLTKGGDVRSSVVDGNEPASGKDDE